MDEIEKVLTDPCASKWLKQALTTAVQRDCVDAANDAWVLEKLLHERLVRIQGMNCRVRAQGQG